MGIGGLLATAFVVGLSGAMMPGSMLVVNIGEAARRGWLAGPLVVLGHALLELILVIMLVLGLETTLSRPVVAAGIGVVGGLVLLWMGYETVKGAYTGTVSMAAVDAAATAAATGQGSGWWRPPVAGAVASLSNPYWLLWWATIGAGFVVTAGAQGPVAVSAFYIGHISADLFWYTLVAVIVATGKRFMTDTLYRGILGTCGVFLIILALYFLNQGRILLGY